MASPLPSATFNPCSGDSHEGLRWKLMYTSIELQKVRAEGRLQETELWRLQELLSMMIKERDEAREECRKLQECVLLQQTPAMGVDSASSFMYSSSMVSSPSSSPWSLQELEEHLNSDDFCPSVGAPTPLELQEALESLVQGCAKGQFSHPKPECTESALGDDHYEAHMQTQNQGLCFDAPMLSHANDEMVCTRSPSVRSLSRQSSSNSSSACVQRYQRGQVSIETSTAMGAMPDGVGQSAPAIARASMVSKPPPSSGVGTSNCGVYKTQQILSVASLAGTSVSIIASESKPPVPTMSSSGGCPVAHDTTVSDNLSCMVNQSSQSLPPSAMALSSGIVPTSSSHCHQQAYPTPMRQLHLPEPPEADPQVMLNSLPEKGKLLQAVMQAGPLLQTLLLAGPLPQWRHPPPALSTRDIPKVSLMPGHVISVPASNTGLPTTLTRKRIAISESGSQNKKPRKLSPPLIKKGKAMRMVSGGSARQEVAAS